MTDLNLKTEFDNINYVPGETVRGEVSWRNDGANLAPEVRLIHYTKGKGGRDVKVVARETFEAPAGSDGRTFEFVLPEHGPYSFSGELVSLIWALELELWTGGPADRLEIKVSPTGEEIDLYRYGTENLGRYESMLKFNKSSFRKS